MPLGLGCKTPLPFTKDSFQTTLTIIITLSDLHLVLPHLHSSALNTISNLYTRNDKLSFKIRMNLMENQEFGFLWGEEDFCDGTVSPYVPSVSVFLCACNHQHQNIHSPVCAGGVCPPCCVSTAASACCSRCHPALHVPDSPDESETAKRSRPDRRTDPTAPS